MPTVGFFELESYPNPSHEAHQENLLLLEAIMLFPIDAHLREVYEADRAGNYMVAAGAGADRNNPSVVPERASMLMRQFELLGKDVPRRNRAMLAGYMLYSQLRFQRHHPDLMKPKYGYLMAMMMAKIDNKNNKMCKLPASKRSLKDIRNEFESVSHFWCAFFVCNMQLDDPINFVHFLSYAQACLDLGSTIMIPKGRPSAKQSAKNILKNYIDHDKAWLIPGNMPLPGVPEDAFYATIPPLSEEELACLEANRHTPFN